MLLSICIPTYNRGPLLAVLVRSVIGSLPAGLRDTTEIVISDNHSTDDTAALVDAAFGSDPRVRVCRPEQHLPTAEENLCFAVGQCRAEFVWTLGDDDSVERETLDTLERLLRAGEHDFLLFNSRSISYGGLLKRPVQVPCLQPRLDMPLLDFVRASGFWFTLAGFSMSVFRRSAADIEEFRRIIGIGKIYSHVVWLIACFHDKRFAFVNEPLVSYRENRYVTEKTDHWEKVSAREGVFDGALWSTCFLRLIDHLVSRGIIERGYLREVVDRSPTHRYFFADEILSHFLRGLRKDIVSHEASVPEAEVAYLLDWAMVLWSDNIVLLSLLDEVVRNKRAARDIRPAVFAEIEAIHRTRCSRRWFEHFHRYDSGGYSVFRHGARWFAVRQDSHETVESLVDALDFGGYENLLFVADSEAELLHWIRERPRYLPTEAEDDPVDVTVQVLTDFNTRTIAAAIRQRERWRFTEWFRLVRALNAVAARKLLRAVGLRR